MRIAFTRLAAGILAVAACSGGGGGNAEKTGAEGSTVELPSGGGTATTIHLVVTGGPHAGTYDATSDNPTCSYGLTGPGSWGNQYSVTDKKPSEFSSLQLIVPDTKDAADGTDRFMITVGFGQLLQPGYTEHTINTGASLSGASDDVRKEGSGTLTIEDRGKSGKVSFKAKTKDNIGLEGTIDCNQLIRSES